MARPIIDKTSNKAALHDRIFAIHISSAPAKTNGSSLTLPQPSRPIGTRLKTTKLDSQNRFLCSYRRNCSLFWIYNPIIKNAAKNDIQPIFISPKVIGISQKMPPVGLLSGDRKMSFGSHKMRMRVRLSL